MATEANLINNRSELVFLYDIKDANPNGDPLEENKPRIDEETEINIVTDVRLKRTIRDYLHDFRKKDIFIIKELEKDGTQKTREVRMKELGITPENVEKQKGKLLEKYIDMRLFGATIALTVKGKERGWAITWTGPVQFRFGRSVHPVERKSVKGTSVMPSAEQKKMGTFVETQILPYSLICFYGIINENTARSTRATEEDVGYLLDGMWNGTKNLITRSKIGQVPRLLLRVVYKENNFHIGDLDRKISLKYEEKEKDGRKLRDISEVQMNLGKLLTTLTNYRKKIEQIEYEVDDEVNFLDSEGKTFSGKQMERILKKVCEKVHRLNLG